MMRTTFKAKDSVFQDKLKYQFIIEDIFNITTRDPFTLFYKGVVVFENVDGREAA
jgi:hypothetical protein